MTTIYLVIEHDTCEDLRILTAHAARADADAAAKAAARDPQNQWYGAVSPHERQVFHYRVQPVEWVGRACTEDGV